MNEIAYLPEPVEQNPKAISIYMIVVVALALLGLATVIGGIVLAFVEKQMPESVIVLGSVAVGALAGMVAPQVR
jgi:hydrogenase/urease accessory protein HupE